MPFGLYQWFANPLLAVAILAHQRFRRMALGCGLAALYLAASSFGIDRLPDSQSYDFNARTGFGAGFYLWLAAIVVFCAGQAWHCWKARSADDMPGWRWLDVALIAALGVALYAATQMPSLRFEPGKVLMPEGATNRTLDRLAAADVSWTTIRYAEVQKNGGGLHCSTTPLIRDPV